MLFKNFVDDFLQVSADNGNSPGELAQKQMAIYNHLVPFFGDMDMEALGIPEVRAYKKEKLAEGYAPKTINNHLIIFSRFLSTAREERKLRAPKFSVSRIAIASEEARYLSDTEIKRFLSAARLLEEEGTHWAAMVAVAMNTGLRIGELLALDWKQVNLQARKLSVTASLCRQTGERKTVKNGQSRDVAINKTAAVALVGLPHRQGRVFDVTYSQAYVAINRIANAAKLDDVGWHTLRHSFASLLAVEGVPLFTISRLLGHKSMRMTERYAHLNDEKNKDAVAVLAAVMG